MDSKIFLEDLVSNLMIIKMDNHLEQEISSSELEAYAGKIRAWLAEYKGVQVNAVFSKHDIEQFLVKYPQFSLVQDGDMIPVIRLSDGYSVEDLRRIFRPYLSVDILLGLARMAKEVLQIP